MIELTPTLVVVVTNQQDWQRVVVDGWYRIPLAHAPEVLAAEYLAFYFTRHFRADAWRVSYYAPIRRYRLLQRRDILPEQAHHQRAEHWYYQIQVGPAERLAQPVRSRRLRRVTFIPTTMEQLLAADDVTDLWQTDDEQAIVWSYFRDAALKGTRHLSLEERRLPY